MKTKEEILNQLYITPSDLKILIPTMGKNKCVEEIKQTRHEMEQKGLFVPPSKPYIALTKLIRKRYGI